ncbi:nucleoid-associated protein [Serpentinicella alkaliphila]|uniref:Nucleoid associated protein NdpA n=1 Tax=Serpentinicella alkaliphila TaxID=1734049 RepID=A0A4R2TQV7_9FIRM|nr:nucleoid-associated protein [Serpentinicella alkaliphila]QUH27061.1 nucleoid-associated protein [Serpentinicella alkaliphila]TCQ05187.1 nucleoid associated protein NdpA [Serpentinicella alkaliphila]
MNDQQTNLKIINSVLHILDNSVQIPVLSTKSMESKDEIYSFLEAHILKVMTSDDIRIGAFNDLENNIVYNCTKEITKDSFIETSVDLANLLFDIMKKNPNIPPADIIFTYYEFDNNTYLAIMKFNYKLSYIHFVLNTDEGTVNNLIRQTTTLPNENQKLEECVLINLTTAEIKLLEKEYEINENKDYYLSKQFLNCNFDLSNNEKFKIINKVTKKVNKKYFDDDFDKTMKFQNVLSDSIKETDSIEIESIAKKVFKDNYEIQHEFINEIKKEGLNTNIDIQQSKRITKKLESHKFKTDNGIEINLPLAYYNNKDLVEFINNPDGTISIIIKNINKIINK